jgi:hypothetical protein
MLPASRCVHPNGAAVAACFLAPVVAGLLYSEFILACWVAMVIGVPIAVVLDNALRPPGERGIVGALSAAVLARVWPFATAAVAHPA